MACCWRITNTNFEKNLCVISTSFLLFLVGLLMEYRIIRLLSLVAMCHRTILISQIYEVFRIVFSLIFFIVNHQQRLPKHNLSNFIEPSRKYSIYHCRRSLSSPRPPIFNRTQLVVIILLGPMGYLLCFLF